jgi:hypothetical protein
MTRHGRRSTSSSILGWQCASAPSRAISEWKPRPLVPPRRWPGLFMSTGDDRFSIVERPYHNHWWAREDSNLQPDRYEWPGLTGNLKYNRRFSSGSCTSFASVHGVSAVYLWSVRHFPKAADKRPRAWLSRYAPCSIHSPEADSHSRLHASDLSSRLRRRVLRQPNRVSHRTTRIPYGSSVSLISLTCPHPFASPRWSFRQ